MVETGGSTLGGRVVLAAQTTATKTSLLSWQYALMVSPACLYNPLTFKSADDMEASVSGSVVMGTMVPGWFGNLVLMRF